MAADPKQDKPAAVVGADDRNYWKQSFTQERIQSLILKDMGKKTKRMEGIFKVQEPEMKEKDEVKIVSVPLYLTDCCFEGLGVINKFSDSKHPSAGKFFGRFSKELPESFLNDNPTLKNDVDAFFTGTEKSVLYLNEQLFDKKVYQSGFRQKCIAEACKQVVKDGILKRDEFKALKPTEYDTHPEIRKRALKIWNLAANLMCNPPKKRSTENSEEVVIDIDALLEEDESKQEKYIPKTIHMSMSAFGGFQGDDMEKLKANYDKLRAELKHDPTNQEVFDLMKRAGYRYQEVHITEKGKKEHVRELALSALDKKLTEFRRSIISRGGKIDEAEFARTVREKKKEILSPFKQFITPGSVVMAEFKYHPQSMISGQYGVPLELTGRFTLLMAGTLKKRAPIDVTDTYVAQSADELEGEFIGISDDFLDGLVSEPPKQIDQQQNNPQKQDDEKKRKAEDNFNFDDFMNLQGGITAATSNEPPAKQQKTEEKKQEPEPKKQEQPIKKTQNKRRVTDD